MNKYVIEVLPLPQEFTVTALTEAEAKSDALKRFSAFNNCPVHSVRVVEEEHIV